jgi:hypothetical protein
MSWVEEPSSPPPATPPVTTAAPPPAAPRRRWLLPALVVAVVAVVVVAALFATGTLRYPGSSASNPAYEIFSQAEAVAVGASGSVAGGPWFATFGAAAATPTAIVEPATNLSTELSKLNCTVVWPNGEPANIAIPSTPETVSVGAAAYWVFGLKNISNALLVEIVSDGVASALLTVGGTTCSGFVSYLAAFPSDMVDSPAIVTTADAHGGSTFLAAHPNASRAWGAYGGAQLGVLARTSPEWFVDYTSCTLPTYQGEVGAVFNATLGGTSGALINASTNTTTCAVTAPSGVELAFHASPSITGARKAI